MIEARMYRITPHSSDDDDRSYRSREEVEEHKKQDPLLRVRATIWKREGCSAQEKYEEMEAKAKAHGR